MNDMDKELFPRRIVVVIFYNKDLNVLVQKRKAHSKAGEKYGFFGGGIENAETAEQALRRELLEELNYKPKQLKYWGRYSFIIDLPDSRFNREVRYGELFHSPITQELLDSKSEDGTEIVLLPIDRVLENRNQEFGPVKFNNISKIKKDLVQLVANL